MKKLDVKRGIAFEDSLAGQASAAAAGLQVVAVSRPLDLTRLVESVLPAAILTQSASVPRAAEAAAF